MPKLFVSHASADISVVKAFVELVEGGIGVPPTEIFCSSLKGQSIRPGKDFKESIRSALGESACVVALVTENFYASAFCMCELGGVWLAAKSFLPVLVPPLDYKALKAVLEGLQVSKLDAIADLDELRDEIAERIEMKPLPTPRWTERRDRFLGDLPALVKAAKTSAPVPREKYAKALEEVAEYKKEYDARGEEIGRLTAMNAELAKTKDRKAVAKIVRAHSTTAETFESLVTTANNALKRLPRIVREACYYHYGRGQDYFPNRDDWDDVHAAVEQGHLTLVNDDRAAALDDKDPKAAATMAAMSELSSFLEEPPEDFGEWYAADYDGVPELERRPFWDEHLPR